MSASPDPAAAAVGTLEQHLGHRFENPALLLLALTHRSWCAEHGGVESNERLEFLGDAVLGLVVTHQVFRDRPELAEGAMAKARAAVVSAPCLAEVAAEIGIGGGLRLGRGEEATGGRRKQSILADALEAVLGAVYLDAGLEVARRVVLGLFGDRLADAASDPGTGDYKTKLQELVARRFDDPPVYLLDEDGPDHDKVFRATVVVDGSTVGGGEGRSKKLAQQAAAREAFETLAAGDPGTVGETPVAAADAGT